ncbi:NUDIX hydrolase [Paenibacillus rigui]|uniref:Hydrolase n=1 Tax=Paenibacillus rigui TaxID=554312 RepID=A0A229UQA6_9BACL|nr:NUDIX domain-containing protein [Paenibacillus rigui]OXM85544.1 hydrolase [Paenibacillus rigui]
MNKQQELFDIFDAQMNPIGIAPRHEVHRKGYWHQTFQCWIVSSFADETAIGPDSSKPALLFQMRHPDKDTFPGLLDISCAGHLLAGEQVEDGLRELVEELGVEVVFEQLLPCGSYREEQYISPNLIDRELCHVFILPREQALKDYRLQEDEVTGLYRIGLADVRLLAQGKAEHIVAEGVETDAEGKLVPVRRTFGQADFVPHAPSYYELVLKGAERLFFKE